MSSKRTVLLLTVVAALILLVASFRPWVSGSSSDPVLAGTPLSASGSQAIPGLLSLAMALPAAGVAAATTGVWPRRIALLGYAVVLGVVGALVVRALLSPAGVLEPVAASSAGRTGDLPVEAAVTIWPWIALVGVLVGALAWVGAVRGQRDWGGLGRRYAAPDTDRAGSRGERVSSDWDRLSVGEDPTLDEPGDEEQVST